MYECKKCGNKQHFIEYNIVKTAVTVDPNTAKVTGTQDTLVERTNVECGICKSYLSDGTVQEVQ